MAVVVIWALELWSKPHGLPVRNEAQISRLLLKYLRLLAIDGAYAEAGILLEYFLSVKI